ncbi:esterase/lipase family protein [uncultured Jatrophihabitans sp.]|uniref:esterase/lipase family protein n=1 Tax=uncultured Jatrophihabitans sp. TaxID=1610747 RepID=UPI0035CC20BD
MRADEMRDTGTLTGTALAEFTELVRDVHKATAHRLFDAAERLTGRGAAPVRLLHDGIAAVAYGSTKLGVTYLPPVIGFVASSFADPAAPSAHDSRRGRAVLGAVGGWAGDRIAEEESALAPVMRARLHGGQLRRMPANLADDARASGTATGRLAVFAHGLCETDLCWSFAAEKRWGDRYATYGSMLRDDDGWTPVYLNFNTGLHISQNGRELAEQLDELVRLWPVEVTEIALIGHSLGGLVARSAAHQAEALDLQWVQPLRHIVGLGTPHMGAPLERAVNWGTHRLARLPETRPFATFLNRRSVGIKDLRYGAVLEDDWLGFDVDELLNDRITPATMLPGVAYSVASATLSREPEGIFAMDLLVQHSSAHGIGKVRTIPFEQDRTYHLGGRKHHFDLLADRSVYDHLRSWLAGADGSGSAAGEPKRRRRAMRQRHNDSANRDAG